MIDLVCIDKDFSFSNPNIFDDIRRKHMYKRRIRRFVGLSPINVGDIINVSYTNKYITYGFEGICICLRRKLMLSPNVTIILRNVLVNVGVELTLAYYYARCYRFTLSNHKRKSFHYRRAKLYYIRTNLNRASRIMA